MEERYHATTQNRFYPDMSNANENITVEAKLISAPTNNECGNCDTHTHTHTHSLFYFIFGTSRKDVTSNTFC